jgi:hypothetical protein
VKNILFEYRLHRRASSRIKSQECLCETWFFMCSTSPLRANRIQYSQLQYMHKPLHKTTSYTKSMHNSYKPITPVNQLAAQRPVISYIHVSMGFEVLTILTLENTVLWNVALHKCPKLSKECCASLFSLTSIMTAFFSLRLCSYIEISQEIAEIYHKCVRCLLMLITQNTVPLPKITRI